MSAILVFISSFSNCLDSRTPFSQADEYLLKHYCKRTPSSIPNRYGTSSDPEVTSLSID